MRKFIISILLAGAAASPALAQDHGRWQDHASQGDREEARDQAREERHQQREQRSAAPAIAPPQQQPQVEQRQQVVDRGGGSGGRHFDRGGGAGQQVEQQQPAVQPPYRGDRNRFSGGQAQQVDQAQQVEQTRRAGNWNRDRSTQQGQRSNWSGQSGNRGSWTGDRSNWTGQSGDNRQHQGTQQQWSEQHRWASGGWNRNWRNDSRYDWRRYRDRHRSIFRLGVYFDPFGYGYRSFDIGYRLQSRYFGQSYWIDPALYGLPHPPPGTQWVRYWNDAVLVDMYSGEVVDVIRNFFW